MTADYADGGWRPRFVCPACSASLDGTATGLWCPSCSADYDCRVGIYRLLSAERLAQLEPFLAQYRHVRRRDGYRTDDPDYYQRLPNVDHNHSQADIWRVRRDTYRRLRSRVLARFADRSLTVLDLGSGSGWLSHRLAELGHRAVALDCLDDDVDGLGVWRRYPRRFVCVQGDFDRLPFASGQFDLVVFNGSLHYAPDVVATVTTAGRLVAPGGALLVMDSPTFRRAADGRAMLQGVERRFRSEYGLGAMVRPGTGYVTFGDLWRAAGALGLRSRFFRSSGGVGWSIGRLVGGLKMRRGPGGVRLVGGDMILLYNPRSTTPGKQPLPTSLLTLAGVLEGRYPWILVDANIERDPASRLIELARQAPVKDRVLGVTVMPGPQLNEAVPVCRRVKTAVPDLPIVWGGYFPSEQTDTVLRAPFVDYVVRSQGELGFTGLIEVLRHGGDLGSVPNVSWTDGSRPVHNPLGPLTPPDELPELPYHRVPMEHYIHRNYLGDRTIVHNSSFGCPFACNFCAVVAMSNRRWLAESPERLERVLRRLTGTYGVDAVQMIDMDFFVSEARVAEFAERITPLGIAWWGLGRIDALMRYADATWRAMQRSGLRMVFSGVESGSDEVIERMNKGGRATTGVALDLARRMREYGVVPEYSFVLGSPHDPLADLQQTFSFIQRVKRVNPSTEIVMYVYTPVPMDGALYDGAQRLGFRFPETLDEWVSDDWRRFSLRRGDDIPWMEGKVRRRVRNFERVLNAFYPTVTDRRLTAGYRALLKTVSAWRYRFGVHGAPYELRALQWLIRYQRPEMTGF